VNTNTTNYTGTSTNNNTNTNNNTTNYTGNSTNSNTNNNTTNYTGNSTNTNNNTNTNNSTVNSTANNTNTNNSTVDQTVNSTSNNNNTNTNNSTSNNTNVNKNESTSDSNVTTNNKNENTNNNKNENINKTDQTIKQEIKSPPPSAIAPSIGASFSQDLCTTGVSGAVQTQLFGVAAGKSVRDENCERIKLSKTVYDMGMKVAAVSLMCQDARVFAAMEMAGTPCPFEGKIGQEAAAAWDAHSQERPDYDEYKEKMEGREKKVEEDLKAKAKEEKIVKREIERTKQSKIEEFVTACKKTRHLDGEHKGVRKSGGTCRKEWAELNS
jgi:hypothetical protein